MKDKREIIRARKAFRRSLKDEKKVLETRKEGGEETGKKIPLYWMKKHGKKEIKEKLEEDERCFKG